MPVYNGELTLPAALSRLDQLSRQTIVKEIIIINDKSKDKSADILTNYKKNTKYKVRIITHDTSFGLAGSYNEGIKLSTTPYVATMHQDIIIEDIDAYQKMIEPLIPNTKVVATYPVLQHSFDLWKDYPLWQKCLFSRHIEREEKDLTGKFDCFKRTVLIDMGLFDNTHYRTAGEDADLKHRLSKLGYSYVCSEVVAIHGQEKDPHFGIQKYFKKEAQLAEARGAVLRRHGRGKTRDNILNFFREYLLIGLFIPVVNFFAFLATVLYAYFYTKRVYTTVNNSSLTIVKIFFVNLALIPVNAFYSFRGFRKGVQRL